MHKKIIFSKRPLFVVFLRGFLASLSVAALCSSIFAEIILDGSLGTKGPLAGPNYLIGSDLGQIHGNNLFHSFSQFNVLTGESATFSGPQTVKNVISRVTGGSLSSIDGLIRSTIPDANLFLLNPNGILFGPKASLDVGGSFHVSTADLLRLSDGGIYYANLSNNSVLTTAPPSAFGFLSTKPASIEIQQSGLQIPTGKTLSFVGGDFTYLGDPKPGYLWVPSGRINLVSVASPGEVSLNDLNTESFSKLGNITMINIQGLNVQGNNIDTDQAGTILIRGGSILIKDSSVALRGNPGGVLSIIGEQLQVDDSFINAATRGPVDHPGRSVDISMTGDVLFTRGSEIASSSFAGGRAGSVRITAKNVLLGDEDPSMSPYASNDFYGDIGSRAFASGNAANVEITATDKFLVQSGFFIGSRTVSTGNGGDVTVHAHTVEVLNSGYIDASALQVQGNELKGNAGKLTVVADDVLLSGKNAQVGFTGLTTQTQGAGNAGSLSVSAKTVQVLDGAEISAAVLGGPGQGLPVNVTADTIVVGGMSPDGNRANINTVLDGTQASGKGGDVSITSHNLEVKDSGFIGSFLQNNAPGNAGDVRISSDSIDISNRGFISAAGFLGTGNAGNIEITASTIKITGLKETSDPLQKDFTGLSALTNAGAGGDIRLKTGSLLLEDHGLISASSIGSGKGGNIDVSASTVNVSANSGILSTAAASGNGGNITLQGGLVTISGKSTISSESTGTANAGDITFRASDSVRVIESVVTTEAAKSDGGNIKVEAGTMIELVNSTISSSVGGGPQTIGGNVVVDSHHVVLNDSRIIANAFEGKGGNIRINADVFLASPESLVDASSALGINGTVDIKAAIASISGTLVPIQSGFLRDEALLRDRCAERIRGERRSSLIVSGRDGMPISPGSVLPSTLYQLPTGVQPVP
ncbi:MAG TPA: filamentous hemagglutinin N-terminal domain-containing protein [Thermodesulfovibrionales bacterium]|nr:filamentous hemagglutinin N-terminal domain-containing protein [Thermodesulfovibrionales bacterium]